MTKLITARIGLLCGVAAAALAFGSAAQAQEGVAIKNMLGSMGIINSERDPIRYRERAPLVVPPKMELRNPAGAETYASNNPQWPKDPDVAARKRRAADERIPVTESEIRRMSENNPRLSVDELRRGRNSSLAGPGAHKSDRDGVWVAPADMEAGRSASDADGEKVAAVTPVRRTLTDPPTTLRQSARGGEVQRDFQGRVDQQERDANPMNWLTRAFQSKDDDE